jgi:hypothetical protein
VSKVSSIEYYLVDFLFLVLEFLISFFGTHREKEGIEIYLHLLISFPFLPYPRWEHSRSLGPKAVKRGI